LDVSIPVRKLRYEYDYDEIKIELMKDEENKGDIGIVYLYT
jgi:hypothetical protein